MTVQRWVREYGKSYLLGKVVHVQSPGERSEVRKLKDRVLVLEKALVDAHLDLRLERAYLEIACEEGWSGSVDDLKIKATCAIRDGPRYSAPRGRFGRPGQRPGYLFMPLIEP